MNKQLKNFLFLAMQKGGNISPQMRQQAQSGQLPMMQMGNDIQKMNQRQASHYGYFQAGGEQERSTTATGPGGVQGWRSGSGSACGSCS